MTQATETSTRVTLPSDTEILVERVLGAGPELVWKAWTDPARLGRWWGPDGFTTTTERFDFRKGGQWGFVMHGPDGTDYQNLITFLEIAEPRRIVYRHDDNGGCGVTEIGFTPTGDGTGTKVSLHMSFPTKEARDLVIREYNAVEGGKQTLANLEAYVDRMRSGTAEHEPVVFSRVFDAPRHLVWESWTREEHLARWFGPRETELTHCSLDLTIGGMMLYCMRGPNGDEHWARWIFTEIREPDRLLFVVSFADSEGNPVRAFFDERWPLEMLTSVRFSEHAGRGKGTLVTVEVEPVNATDEELAVFFSGRASMVGGWSGTFDKLAAYLPGINS